MIFTDSDGKKYEHASWVSSDAIPSDCIVVRPIQETKWSVKLVDDAWEPGYITIEIDLGKLLPKDQANLIKKSVEAVMKEIFQPKGANSHSNPINTTHSIYAARKAIQKGSNDGNV